MASSVGSWAGVQEEPVRAPQITKPDSQFLKDHLEFVWGAEGIDLAELNNLFELVSLLF